MCPRIDKFIPGGIISTELKTDTLTKWLRAQKLHLRSLV